MIKFRTLQKGDRVITNNNYVGKIVSIDKDGSAVVQVNGFYSRHSGKCSVEPYKQTFLVETLMGNSN